MPYVCVRAFHLRQNTRVLFYSGTMPSSRSPFLPLLGSETTLRAGETINSFYPLTRVFAALSSALLNLFIYVCTRLCLTLLSICPNAN